VHLSKLLIQEKEKKKKKESKKQHVTQFNTVACLIAQQHDTVSTESNMGLGRFFKI
jgi:hypothetical protein